MGVLEFIFGVIVVLAIVFTALMIFGMKYNAEQLEEENKKLKENTGGKK